MNFKFGEQIVFDTKLERIYGKNPYDSKINKFWKYIHMQPTNGIFLGWRTLSNGYVVRYYDEGPDYDPKEYIKVALVAYSPKRKPIYVPLEGVIK